MTAKIPKEHRDELARFFTELAPSLSKYAYWLTRGDRFLTQDLVQEAFQQAARWWPEIRCWSMERQLGWLRGTVRNLFVTSVRHSKAERNAREALSDRYRPPASDTHGQALTSIVLLRCWEVIDAMPERRHMAALMRWGEGMSLGEIADVMGITEGAVSAHLAAARKNLLEEIGQELPFDLNKTQPEEGSVHE